jgi:hypothetical protein
MLPAVGITVPNYSASLLNAANTRGGMHFASLDPVRAWLTVRAGEERWSNMRPRAEIM